MPGTHHLRGIDDSSVVAKLERAYCSNGDGKDQRCGDLGGLGGEKQSLRLLIDDCLLLIKETYLDNLAYEWYKKNKKLLRFR